MKISFVTCSNVAPPSWLDLFEGIAGQIEEGGAFEVVAVNNGFPPAREQELFDSAPVSRLGARFRLVRESRRGIAYARFSGMAAATGEWLVLLDDDNSVASDFLVALRAELSAQQGIGGVVGLITPEWEKPVPDWLAKFGVNCLSYTSPSISDQCFVSGRLSGPESVRYPAPPGGGMIIHASVFGRYRGSPNLTDRLKLGRVGSGSFGCDDFDLWSEIFELKLDILVSRKLRMQHHIPARRTGFLYLCRLNYQMSYSFGYLSFLNNEDRQAPSIWNQLRQAKCHLMKGIRQGCLRLEVLWWIKSLGSDRGFRDGFLKRPHVEGKSSQ